MDDRLMEKFFCLLKMGKVYSQEYKYHKLQELTENVIENLRRWHNNEQD